MLQHILCILIVGNLLTCFTRVKTILSLKSGIMGKWVNGTETCLMGRNRCHLSTEALLVQKISLSLEDFV